MKPFKFWVQTALPLVYDDSLSYYELLCKVVDYINGFMGDLTQFGQVIDSYTQKVEEIEAYVNGYFESADFTELVDQRLDQMAQDGEFDDIIQPIVAQLSQNVADELAHVEQVTNTFNARVVALEGTSVSQGEAISQNESDIDALQAATANINDEWKLVFVSGNSIGDCFYLCNNGNAIMFDCGNDSNATNLKISLHNHEVTKILAIVVSHWHSDHINGLSGLLADSGFDFTGCVLYRPHNNLNYSRCVGDWVAYVPDRVTYYTSAVTALGGSAVDPTEGSEHNIDGIKLAFSNLSTEKFENYYNVTTDEKLETTNETQYNNFCMLCAAYLGETKLAFSADLMPESEAQNREFPVAADIYKIEHHALNRDTDAQYANSISAPINIVTDYGAGHSECMRTKTPTVNRCLGIGSVYDSINGEIEFVITKFGVSDTGKTKAVNSALYHGVVGAGITLYNGIDFNNLTQPGVYGIGSYTILQRMTNAPSAADSGGKLIVDSVSNSGYINQIYIQSNSQTPAIHIRCRAWDDTNEVWVWRNWRTIRPSTYLDEVTTGYYDDSVTVVGTHRQNRYRLENGILTVSLYFTTLEAISANTSFLSIPLNLSDEYTSFVLVDENDSTVYPCVIGPYRGNTEVWCLKAIPADKTLAGYVSIAVWTNYPN